MWRKGNSCALLVGIQTGPVTAGSSMEVPQKIKSGSAFCPSDPSSGNLFQETWNTNLKEYMHAYVHGNIIYNRQDMEAAQVSINRWADKTTMGHLHNGILLNKKKILPFATVWLDLGNIMLSEIRQSEKDKYDMISLICGVYWTNWTNKQNQDRLMDGEQMTASWWGEFRGWRDWTTM